jgi:glycosyltransferase involved in cell wall biosynthesis
VIDRLLDHGWMVVGAARIDSHADVLRSAGVVLEEVCFARGGLKPWHDALAYRRLRRIYGQYQPQLVQHLAGKPSILGCAALWSAPATKVANLITGLGHPYVVGRWQEWLANRGFATTLGRADVTVFENPDDRAEFIERGLVTCENSIQLVASGVDIERNLPVSRDADCTRRVLMPARLIWEKGVREFVEAATICRRRFPDVQFQLAGEFDPQHADAISENWIVDAVRQRAIEFLGYVNKMHEVVPQCDLVVLPSYREGTPRVLLEAAACGVPAVATDVPGCREAVRHDVTGLLVPPRDARALAEAICALLADPVRCQTMGQAARRFVEQEFDDQVVADRYVALYESLGIQVRNQTFPQVA